MNWVEVSCHTNLDVREEWPHRLSCRPVVGDIIESTIKRCKGYGLELQVVRVAHRTPKFRHDEREAFLEVELHLLPNRFENISSFTKWYEDVWCR